MVEVGESPTLCRNCNCRCATRRRSQDAILINNIHPSRNKEADVIDTG